MNTNLLEPLRGDMTRLFKIAALAFFSMSVAGGAVAAAPTTLPAEIVIGATLPLTGPGAAYGKIMQDGLQLGFDQALKDRVLGKTKFQIEVRDDQAQPGLAVSQTRELLRKNAVAIVTAFTSPPLAQIPIASRAKVPLFNGGGNDPSLLGRDYLWNDVMMVDQEAKVGMKYARDNLNVKKIAILFETNYTPSALTAIETAWREVGGEKAVSESVEQSAATVGPQLEKLLASKPDALYLAVDGNISSLALKEIAQRNVGIPVITYSAGAVVPEAISVTNTQLYYTTASFSVAPEFAKLANAAGIRDVSIYHVNYYNIAQTIVHALKRAVDQGMTPTGESIEKILQASFGKSFPGCCGNISYNKKHGAGGKVTVYQMINGTPVKNAELDAS